MKNLFTLAALLFVLSLHAQQTWKPSSMIKYKRLSGATISPDGKRVAYTVSVPLMEGEKSEYLTHVWVAATDGSLNRQFTFGDKSCDNPQFSPDDKWLSFTSQRNSEDKNQLFVIPLSGGEAEQITKLKGSIGTYSWSPDGARIAFVMPEPLTEKEEKDKKEKKDITVVDNYKNSHLYTVSLLNKNDKNEYPVKRLTKGDFHVTGLNWSPDGNTIAFAHQVSAALDLWPTTDISLVPSDSGSVKLLIKEPGLDFQPMFSPDGQWIAYVSDGGKARWARRTHLYVVPFAGGPAKKMATTFDEQPEAFSWTSDSKSVLFAEAFKTTRVVYSLPMDGRKPVMITSANGFYTSPSISKTGDWMGAIFQDASTPPQVIAMNLKDHKLKTLSSVNGEFVRLNHAKTEVKSWKSKDGKYEIEGLVTYPAGYEKGKRYPLILNIHGGPAGVFSQNYTGASSPYPLQAFASGGYAVLRVNPRGSSGYGGDFRHANTNDWGFGDYDDIMAGVDKLIADGIAHADSLCVTGWSYGGYMTSMIITKTNRFKAAMVGAGVTNLISMTGTSDIPGFLPDYFGGEVWDRMEVYQKHSAMFAVKNVKTPTLIIHGERDLRVPISQGQELYMALKRLGVKTQMVTYPRTPHGPQEPKFIQDIGERVISWFNDQCRSQPGKLRTAGVE